MAKKFNEDIDRKIIDCLNNETKNISSTDNMFFKIRGGIAMRNEKKLKNNRLKFSKSKTVVAGLALCVVTTVGALAATNGGLSWISSTNNLLQINKFPTEEKVESTVGFAPKYVENFECGFKFDSFNFSNESLKDEAGNSVFQTKGADFEYTRKGAKKGQSLSLHATPVYKGEGEMDKTNSYKEDYNGIELIYSNFKYKSVPEDYKPTEEEKALVANGELQIGYGSSEISETSTQHVFWEENGVRYSILNMGYDDITKDQMIEMAKEVINQ